MRVRWRAGIVAAIAVAASASVLSGDAEQPPQSANTAKPTGVIEGVVVDAKTGRPVPGLTVTALGASDRSLQFGVRDDSNLVVSPYGAGGGTVMSDAAGRFHIGGLPPAWYDVTASGRAGGSYGQSSPSDPARMIALAAGQRRSGLRVQVFSQPTISGRVADDAGRPAIGVTIDAIRLDPSVTDGWTRQAITDDRGIYSLTVPPGEFAIVARPPPLTDPNAIVARPSSARAMVYPATYFPGGSSIDDARKLDLRRGDDLDGVDIRLERVPASTVVATFPPVTSKGFADFRLVQSTGEREGTAPALRLQDGRVSWTGVPSGAYELRVRIPPEMPRMSHGVAPLKELPAEPTLWARQALTVTDPETRVAVSLQPGVRISGSVVFEGGPPPEMQMLQAIVVEDAADSNIDLRGLYLSTTSFTTIQLPPGSYLLRPFAPSKWYVKSITLAGRDVLDGVIEVQSTDVAGVTITITNRPARVRGVVTLDGPTESVRPWVTIFPAERALWKSIGTRPFRLTCVLASASGSYEAILPPGTYYAAATAALPNLPQDFDALATIAETIVISDGMTTTQNFSAAKRLR